MAQTDEPVEQSENARVETFSVSLVTQGNHRFYTLTMPSEVLAESCTVDTRLDNPIDGFQRKLDVRRADEIARYIDEELGTIPSSIVLSAQKQAELKYDRSRRSITFKVTPRSFLILDGQHRVFGFAKAKTRLRVPVVIYNNLTRAQECQLFMDINTKQRPVPNELLLDIKRLAETETDNESLLRDLFDRFDEDANSPLAGRLSPSSKAKGKLSRVTFNAALKSVWNAFEASATDEAYSILSSYLRAWSYFLKKINSEELIANAALFRAVILLFPDVAQRVVDRHGRQFSTETFADVLEPFFSKLKPASIRDPGNSHVALYERFQRALRQQFTIAGI